MFEGHWALFAYGLEFIIRLTLAALILLRRRGRKPTSTLAWVAIILIFPLIGIIAYTLLGEPRLGRRRVQRHAKVVSLIEKEAGSLSIPREGEQPEIAAAFQPIAQLAESVARTPPRGGNVVQLFGQSDLFIQSLIEAIDAAERHCHLAFYIYLADHSGTRTGEALMRAAKRGVRVRLLVDGVGSKLFLRSSLRAAMEKAGVQVVAALPANPVRMLLSRVDIRNHRKIAVIDGAVAFTGSQNIADAEFAIKRRYAPWIDAALRVEGPIVRDLQLLFIQDWYMDTSEFVGDALEHAAIGHMGSVTAQVIGTGPNAFNEALHEVVQASFHLAREELVLTTPYFVPDEGTILALVTAAQRGVTTRLIVPAHNDSPLVAAASRSHYERLLEAGVELYEYRRGLLHAKTISVDRDLALIGTANLDCRSFELNFEVSVLIYDDDLASELRFLQTEYLSQSDRIELDGWRRRPVPQRLWYYAAGMMSPLL